MHKRNNTTKNNITGYFSTKGRNADLQNVKQQKAIRTVTVVEVLISACWLTSV